MAASKAGPAHRAAPTLLGRACERLGAQAGYIAIRAAFYTSTECESWTPPGAHVGALWTQRGAIVPLRGVAFRLGGEHRIERSTEIFQHEGQAGDAELRECQSHVAREIDSEDVLTDTSAVE